MTKILFDHQMFSMQRFGGITRYFADLIYNLPFGFTGDLVLKYSENHYITKTYKQNYKKIDQIENFRIKRRFYYMVNQHIAKKAIKNDEFDLFHPTYYDPYFLSHIKKPFVMTIHDMIHEIYADTFPAYNNIAKHKKILAEKANHIIAVSENTKNDIIKFIGINPEKISVVYHGYNQQIEACEQIYDNYILYVGERKNYKNFIPFINAILPLLQADKALKVVSTGNPFSPEELAFFQKQNIVFQLIHVYANDAVLYSLYQHALTFVFPSLYEGFGIPILEAFANNCPVCLSNSSCFLEIAQDAVLYFNPQNKQSIFETIQKIITNHELRETLIIKGRKRIVDFSIENMVINTCNVYQNVLFS